MQPFILTSDLMQFHDEDTCIVNIPTGLSTKKILLAWYVKAIRLPEYFAANWDAFDECIRDLSWIKHRRLVLYHQEVPLEECQKDQKIYIDILADAIRDWKPGEAHELAVIFEPACELKLHAIARDR